MSAVNDVDLSNDGILEVTIIFNMYYVITVKA